MQMLPEIQNMSTSSQTKVCPQTLTVFVWFETGTQSLETKLIWKYSFQKNSSLSIIGLKLYIKIKDGFTVRNQEKQHKVFLFWFRKCI